MLPQTAMPRTTGGATMAPPAMTYAMARLKTACATALPMRPEMAYATALLTAETLASPTD